MLKYSPIFKRNGAHLVEKKDFWNIYIDLFLKFECFEHVIFAINRKYCKKIMTIQNIMLHLWSFKHAKMQFHGVSTHLGGSFDCVLTLLGIFNN
jgi:hypothetical protein